MKLGHYIFTLAVLFFAIVFPFVGFSDGSCYLEQSPNGQFVIRCEGDGIWYNYVDKTNEIYIIKNCEALKSQLVSSVDSISDSLWDSRTNYLHSAIGSLYGVESLVNNLYGDDKEVAVSSIQDVRSDLLNMDSSLDGVANSLSVLRSDILGIECGSCSDSGDSGGSCCDVNLSPVLDKLNEAQLVRISMTNILTVVSSALSGLLGYDGATTYNRMNRNSKSGILGVITGHQYQFANSNLDYLNIVNQLRLIGKGLSESLSSINNYLYKITELQLSSISNHVENIDKTFSEFSFFLKQKSPLYGNESPSEGYYSYLTNFYLDVAFERVSSTETRTNWFSRIETLLASLVFADAPANQLQEDTSTENAVERIGDSLTSLNDAPASQLTTFEDASRSVVDSIQSFSGVITDITKPSTIVLVRQSSGGGGSSRGVSSDGDFTIEFQSSEIDSLVEACRCVTTLAWTFGGLFLAYWFIHWCLMTSYRLVVFCYSVLSSIFGRS